MSKLSDFDDFREQLFSQKGLIEQIKQISVSTDQYEKYEIEIQTILCQCLDKITQINQANQQRNDISQIEQIKIFNKYLINLALQKDYFIKRLDEEDSEEGLDNNDEMGSAYLREALSPESTPRMN